MENINVRRLEVARERISENKYLLDAWAVLIKDAQEKKIGAAREFFETLIVEFPTCGKFWKMYIESEMKARNFERVEKLFQRCLIKVLNIDLWKCYLNYVRDTKCKLPTFRETMAQAFDFALEKIGMDVSAFSIWNDYINFLRSIDANGVYAETQKASAIRKVYLKALQIPMMNFDQIWKDYCAFEMSINPVSGPQQIEELCKQYMDVRVVTKEYENLTRVLDRNSPCVPPQRTVEETKQVTAWKKYIAWEKTNPLNYQDHMQISRRVIFAYEQCLLCLGYHPDIWYEAAEYLQMSSAIMSKEGNMQASKAFIDDTAKLYDRGISTYMKNHMLLYFAYADFEENRSNINKALQIYERLLENPDVDPTLCYILLMRFSRRIKGINAARSVFCRARMDSRCNHHVYTASALMEYHCSQDKNIAFKIFELGMEKFGSIPEYVSAYLDYLSHLNEEDSNTRVLFERVLEPKRITEDQKKKFAFSQIWLEFLKFECQVGDLSSIMKVEKRRQMALEQVDGFSGYETALLIDRYRFLNLFPCSQEDLKSFGYKNVAWLQSLPPSLRGEFVFEERKKYPTPDPDHMIPFKPSRNAPPGSHATEGGVFPFPPAALELLKKMPPPHCFEGPHVIVDKFMEYMLKLEIPEKFNPLLIQLSGEAISDTDYYYFSASRISRKSGANSDDEDDFSFHFMPKNDIFRKRRSGKRFRRHVVCSGVSHDAAQNGSISVDSVIYNETEPKIEPSVDGTKIVLKSEKIEV